MSRTVRVDATGLNCPVPVRELARAVTAAAIGDVVELTATDPAARVDIPVWCRLQRHRLVAISEVADGWRFEVERAR